MKVWEKWPKYSLKVIVQSLAISNLNGYLY